MVGEEIQIISELERLQFISNSDFIGLAWFDRTVRRLRWKAANGSCSKRTLLMSQKPGSGLAGRAWRSGRAVVVADAMEAEDKDIREDPVMLAENLISAAALPLADNNGPCCVVLMGMRTERDYTSELLHTIENEAKRLASIAGHLSENQLSN